jgi:hypothetical protein
MCTSIFYLILFITIFFTLFLYIQKREGFIGNSTQIENNMNYNDSIQNQCNETNPIIQRYVAKCSRRYIDLDREVLKVPLYFYPTLEYHPLDEPE